LRGFDAQKNQVTKWDAYFYNKAFNQKIADSTEIKF